jgi:hypothetical protein
MKARVSSRDNSGKLLEVYELLVNDGPNIVPYWFLFENDRLVKWGKPEEWKAASAGYDINYTPSPTVKR